MDTIGQHCTKLKDSCHVVQKEMKGNLPMGRQIPQEKAWDEGLRDKQGTINANTKNLVVKSKINRTW